MAVATEVIAGILIAILLIVTAFTLFVGVMGALFSEGFERCPHCGRWTLGLVGMAHPRGCPDTFSAQVTHVVRAALHHVPLGHH